MDSCQTVEEMKEEYEPFEDIRIHEISNWFYEYNDNLMDCARLLQAAQTLTEMALDVIKKEMNRK